MPAWERRRPGGVFEKKKFIDLPAGQRARKLAYDGSLR